MRKALLEQSTFKAYGAEARFLSRREMILIRYGTGTVVRSWIHL